jgi:hypothetical protein
VLAPHPSGHQLRYSQLFGAFIAIHYPSCVVTDKDIAQLFAISETTVKHHLTNIFDKIGVSTRLELAMFAVSYGFHSDATLLSSLMQ